MAEVVVTFVGGVEGVMVWFSIGTVIDWVTGGAAFQSALPPWLKSRTQVPAPVKVTVPVVGERVQPVEAASRVMATGRFEVAVAVGV